MRAMIGFVVGDLRVYGKVREEIDSAVKNGTVTFPLSYSDASNLPYFQVSMLQGNAPLASPIPWTLSRSVGEGGTTISGYYFSEGTEVSMSPFVLHRQHESYGDDADVFQPERWIETDVEQRKTMEHNNLAFRSGPRVCIGKVIGMMKISKVMPLLFWKYAIEFTPRSATSPHKCKVGRAVDGHLSVAASQREVQRLEETPHQIRDRLRLYRAQRQIRGISLPDGTCQELERNDSLGGLLFAKMPFPNIQLPQVEQLMNNLHYFLFDLQNGMREIYSEGHGVIFLTPLEDEAQLRQNFVASGNAYYLDVSVFFALANEVDPQTLIDRVIFDFRRKIKLQERLQTMVKEQELENPVMGARD
ncbi:cytochrome P450 [Mycena maculata]|uniref:Cytochrome P450 n=1 Tax=Mycena maculata TaxID=230809 RepID=A0AAD7MLB7_9AGAR|nr:cytochrome P450 [Mycena maculata]